MTSRLIIGVDPGLHVGFAVLRDNAFSSCTYTPSETVSELDSLLCLNVPTIVAVERFTPGGGTSKMTRQTDALRLIGALQFVAKRHSTTFLIQGAGDTQSVGTREVLTHLGWWVPGVDHQNQAAAQVALALMRSSPTEFMRLTQGTSSDT